jgi:hypothetical protein
MSLFVRATSEWFYGKFDLYRRHQYDAALRAGSFDFGSGRLGGESLSAGSPPLRMTYYL